MIASFPRQHLCACVEEQQVLCKRSHQGSKCKLRAESAFGIRDASATLIGRAGLCKQVTQAAMELGELEAELSDIADAEWLDGICASYQPTKISDGLWVIPSWCEPPEPSATNIIVEPGLAFGTGE